MCTNTEFLGKEKKFKHKKSKYSRQILLMFNFFLCPFRQVLFMCECAARHVLTDFLPGTVVLARVPAPDVAM